MLDDLYPYLTDDKARDLLNRVEHRDRVEQALPGEIELSLLWGMSRLGRIEVEPLVGGPDAYSDALIAGHSAAVEIAAPTDNRLSGEVAMDAVAQVFCNFANAVKSKAGDHLYFRFQEISGYEEGRYFRRRLANRDYKMSDETCDRTRKWLIEAAPNNKIRIRERGIDVEIEFTQHKQIRYHNIWSSMPPEAHSLTDNPIFDLMNRKRTQQLARAPAEMKRLIFLGDAGSTLVRNIGGLESDSTRRRVSGSQIIHNFLNRYQDEVDGVVTFSPHRRSFQSRPIWRVILFSSPKLEIKLAPFEKLAGMLPAPRYEGYQARSLFRQNSFDYERRGSWLPTAISWNRGETVKYKISARALLDLLAGRIRPEQFRYVTGERVPGKENMFKGLLDKGEVVSAASFEAGGVDEDDDYLVLEFTDDPSARRLRVRNND